ncbi:hypothetical protein PENNAL_c0746G03348, partial [Penicillium nalgiovense]
YEETQAQDLNLNETALAPAQDCERTKHLPLDYGGCEQRVRTKMYVVAYNTVS